MDRGVSPFIGSPKSNACRVAGERASIEYNITQHDDRSPIRELTLSLCNKEMTEERSRGVARGDNNRQYLIEIHLY